jgi:hypothetical protein
MLAALRGFQDVVLVLDTYVLGTAASGPAAPWGHRHRGSGSGGAVGGAYPSGMYGTALHAAVPFTSTSPLPATAGGGASGVSLPPPLLPTSSGLSGGLGVAVSAAEAGGSAGVGAGGHRGSYGGSGGGIGGGVSGPGAGGAVESPLVEFLAWLEGLGLAKYSGPLAGLGFDRCAWERVGGDARPGDHTPQPHLAPGSQSHPHRDRPPCPPCWQAARRGL